MRAFIVDAQTGTLKYSTDANALPRMQIPDDELVILSDKFNTAVPNIYWNKAIQDFEPLKDMQLSVTGNRISGIPSGATAKVDAIVVTVDDGELIVEGPVGASRRATLRALHYLPTFVPVTCEGYLDD